MREPTARVLVVDDDPDLLAALADTLGDEGYDVEAVSSGRAAVAAARRRAFDVALTDLVMPDMDGADTVAALRAVDATLPIVVGTAYATMETAIACMKHGAFDYVRKPYDLGELTLLLSRALERRKLTENVALLQASQTLLETVDETELRARIPRQARALLRCEAVLLVSGVDRTADPPTGPVSDELIAGIAAHAHAQGGPVLFPGSAGPLARELEDAAVRSALACPLAVRGRDLGLLIVFRRAQPCTAHDLWAGSVFAAGAALALDNARLYAELSERLAATGRLAAGMAHEINNPLTIVHGNLLVLRDYTRSIASQTEDDASSDMAPVVQDSLDGVKRIRQLIATFGRLAEPPQPAEVVPFGDLVDEALVGVAEVDRPERGPVAAEQRVRVARSDVVAALRNLLAVAAEHRAGSALPRLRLDVLGGAGAIELRIVAPGLLLPVDAHGTAFDPVLLTDAQLQRVRIDFRLLIAHQLLLRNGAAVTAHREGDGTVLSVTFGAG